MGRMGATPGMPAPMPTGDPMSALAAGNAAPAPADTRQHAVVNSDRCNLCGACEAVCPFEAISLGDEFAEVNHELCRGCGACVSACPNEAIRLT